MAYESARYSTENACCIQMLFGCTLLVLLNFTSSIPNNFRLLHAENLEKGLKFVDLPCTIFRQIQYFVKVILKYLTGPGCQNAEHTGQLELDNCSS